MESLIYSQLVRSTGQTTWGLWFASEIGGALGGWALTLWDLTLSPGDSIRIELGWRMPSWCLLWNWLVVCREKFSYTSWWPEVTEAFCVDYCGAGAEKTACFFFCRGHFWVLMSTAYLDLETVSGWPTRVPPWSWMMDCSLLKDWDGSILHHH